MQAAIEHSIDSSLRYHFANLNKVHVSRRKNPKSNEPPSTKGLSTTSVKNECSWSSTILTVIITAIITAVVTNLVNDWLPKLLRQVKGELVYSIAVRQNNQPVTGVKFNVSNASRPEDIVAIGITDKYGLVSLSTGTGSFNLSGVLCKGGAYGQDMTYFGLLTINSLPDSKVLELDNDFKMAEAEICNVSSVPIDQVTDVKVTSNKRYGIGKLEEPAIAYVDRSFRFTKIPEQLVGKPYLITSNDDKCPDNTSSFALSFNLTHPATVYVSHDDRYKNKPSWLLSFEQTSESLTLTLPGTGSRYKCTIYKKDFPSGRVSLGSNIDRTCQEEGNFGMYSVIFVPRE